jgi:hypothetical protein
MEIVVADYEIPLLEHTIIGRSSMRSVADAIDALRNEQRLAQGSLAQIRTNPLRLPTGEEPSIVLVVCRANPGEHTWGVALPTSSHFTGARPGQSQETFEISRLDRGSVNEQNLVMLPDGTCLNGVNVIPAPICRELTPLQKRIVYRTLALIPAKSKRYRGPASLDLKFLDYSTLYGLDLPSLKEIQRQLYKKDRKLRRVPHQTIANALNACGMRRPRSGRLAT